MIHGGIGVLFLPYVQFCQFVWLLVCYSWLQNFSLRWKVGPCSFILIFYRFYYDFIQILYGQDLNKTSIKFG